MSHGGLTEKIKINLKRFFFFTWDEGFPNERSFKNIKTSVIREVTKSRLHKRTIGLYGRVRAFIRM